MKTMYIGDMDLKTYIMKMEKEARIAFAKRVGASVGHLQNVGYGYKPCAAELAIAIERESAGLVRFESLCPGIDVSHMRSAAA